MLKTAGVMAGKIDLTETCCFVCVSTLEDLFLVHFFYKTLYFEMVKFMVLYEKTLILDIVISLSLLKPLTELHSSHGSHVILL